VDDMTDDRDHDGGAPDGGGGLDLVVCPECAAPAEVVDRFALPGTDGPVAHAKIRCLLRHWFLLPVAALPTQRSVAEPRWTLWR
jgi:hypothetical protein